MSNKNLEISVAEKLVALYSLQVADSKIDEIKILRGELPLELEDLEDEITGFKTRYKKFQEEVKDLEKSIKNYHTSIEESNVLIKRYKEQQLKVRNNREYDSLSKEIEYQTLEIELSEKRIKKFTSESTEKTKEVKEIKALLSDRKKEFELKTSQLSSIVEDTKKEEKILLKKSVELETLIEERLLKAYKRIRGNARNGLAVVPVERDACGGCFNKIPPQRQLDIASRRKIIVCEYCGRILVDKQMKEEI
ncbi:MAG: hypothetical protein B6I24_04815 [Bacteroidetes bacterium 4572_128]|nr:MAG: hypothetical protein B6I24_04815 [Bacteroidetes bacterium 4572_128]